MKLPIFEQKKIKQLLPTGFLVLLLSWCVLQKIFVSEFDLAKSQVSAWPFLSAPHLQFAQILFEDGQQSYHQEFDLAKKTFLTNPKKIRQAEKILDLEALAWENIDFWQTFPPGETYSPSIARQLCYYNLQLYQDAEALIHCQQAFLLDPNNEGIKQTLESVQKLSNLGK